MRGVKVANMGWRKVANFDMLRRSAVGTPEHHGYVARSERRQK